MGKESPRRGLDHKKMNVLIQDVAGKRVAHRSIMYLGLEVAHVLYTRL